MYLLFDFCGKKKKRKKKKGSFFLRFFLPFFPLPSSLLLLSLPGLRRRDKWLLFSVAKKGTTAAFSRIYRPGGREGGGRGRRDAVKSRSSAGQINSNRLRRTGDGIASLKIQGGRNINVTVGFSRCRSLRSHSLLLMRQGSNRVDALILLIIHFFESHSNRGVRVHTGTGTEPALFRCPC